MLLVRIDSWSKRGGSSLISLEPSKAIRLLFENLYERERGRVVHTWFPTEIEIKSFLKELGEEETTRFSGDIKSMKPLFSTLQYVLQAFDVGKSYAYKEKLFQQRKSKILKRSFRH